jgi:hypothetical protein
MAICPEPYCRAPPDAARAARKSDARRRFYGATAAVNEPDATDEEVSEMTFDLWWIFLERFGSLEPLTEVPYWMP